MFVTKRIIGAALLATCLAAQAQQVQQAIITVDGQAGDWASVPALASATGQSAQSLKAAVIGNYLYIAVQGENLEPTYNLFINTDNNSKTGYQAANSWSTSGAEFLLSGGVLSRSTGAGWNWEAVADNGSSATGTVAVSANRSVIEAQIPLAALGLTASTASGISIGLQAVTATWSIGSILPTTSAFAKLSAGAPAAPGAGPAFKVGKGMIIPAYLTLDDAADWNLLKEGAAQMQASPNPTFKDFWVTVNSGNSGPFQSAAEWVKAKSVWDPIRANGGRIFGYIHALQSPDSSTPQGRLYRDLASVKADIAAWVSGYPSLDGIWIDEFYPRFEIAQPEAGDALVYPRDYPNGAAYAPADTGFINSLGQFNGKQVDPTGGYFSQLTSWIHATYPQLRLIGNAGGDMYSNQYRYGDLVDVLVSFEQNFDTAYATGIVTWQNGTAVETDKYMWHGLDRLNQVTTAPGSLALIHGNAGNMALAIDQAISHGYTHVYTTDRVFQNNVWGGLASYMTSEIGYETAKP